MATVYGSNRSEWFTHYDGLSDANDVVIAGGGNDIIYTYGGNDVLKGGGGADKLYGGAGIDTADYSDSDAGVQVSLAVGAGSGGTAEGDKLYDIENLSGSSYDDTLVGDENANSLYGEGGNDVLKGGGGADKLYGGAGDDLLNSDAIGDYLDGGTGNDTANFSDAEYGVYVNLGSGFFKAGPAPFYPAPGTPPNIVNIENVKGSNSIDTIIGSSGDNVLSGLGGDDKISGGGGNDTILGGSGKDRMSGDAGNDFLTGGAGDDTFIFDAYANTPVNIGNDIVTDFTVGQDHVQFDNAIFADFADVQAHMQQVGNDVVITYDGGNTVTLQNVAMGSLSASDFLFS